MIVIVDYQKKGNFFIETYIYIYMALNIHGYIHLLQHGRNIYVHVRYYLELSSTRKVQLEKKNFIHFITFFFSFYTFVSKIYILSICTNCFIPSICENNAD